MNKEKKINAFGVVEDNVAYVFTMCKESVACNDALCKKKVLHNGHWTMVNERKKKNNNNHTFEWHHVYCIVKVMT